MDILTLVPVFLTGVIVMVTPPILWFVWNTLIQEAIGGNIAGIQGLRAKPFDRVLTGYLGLCALLCLIAMWVWLIVGLRTIGS